MVKIMASSKGTKRPPASAGTHVAILNQIVDVGLQESRFGEQPKGEVFLAFEICDEFDDWVDSTGPRHEPRLVNATVTKSLSEKAKLRAYVEGILGRRLADAETKNCDIVALVGGRPCLLNVEHNESGGNVYANIKSVSPLPKAMKAPTPVGTLVTYSPDEHDEATWEKLPRFLKEKIGKRIEDEAPKKITPAEDAARSMDFWGLAKEPPATDEGVPYNDEIPH